jgi:hypothetical protein
MNTAGYARIRCSYATALAEAGIELLKLTFGKVLWWLPFFAHRASNPIGIVRKGWPTLPPVSKLTSQEEIRRGYGMVSICGTPSEVEMHAYLARIDWPPIDGAVE